MTKSLIKNLLIALALLAGLLIAYLAGSGNLLQGYLNFPLPIFESCTINSDLVIERNIDCNNFDQERIDLPDGDYTLSATYVNKQLANNGKTIIPLKIIKGETVCTFLENGFQPYILISDVTNSVSNLEKITQPSQISLGTVEKLIKINFLKDGQISTFDQHICGNGIEGKVFHEDQFLGTVKLNKNGLLNTTNIVNEIRLNPSSLYYNEGLKPNQPGSYYLSLNTYPDLKFQFEIACSLSPESANLENLAIQPSQENFTIQLNGLSTEFFQKCSNKLYISIQDSKNYQNNYIINNLVRYSENGQNFLQIKLLELPFLNNPDLKLPYEAIVKLHLKDRSDSTEVKTLGEFSLTVANKISNKSSQATTPLFNLSDAQANLLNSSISTPNLLNFQPDLISPEENLIHQEAPIENAPKIRRVEFLNENIAPTQGKSLGPEKPLSSQKKP